MKKKSIFRIFIYAITIFFAFKLGQFLLNLIISPFTGIGGFQLNNGFHLLSFITQPFMLFGHWLFFLFVPIGLILAGIALWKTAKSNSLKKWIGITLFTMGMLMIIPKMILIPLVIIGFYLVCKSKNNKRNHSSYDYTKSASFTNADFLDQWERKTK